MRKRVKVLIALVVVVALSGTGAAIAIGAPGNGGERAAAGATSTTSTAPQALPPDAVSTSTTEASQAAVATTTDTALAQAQQKLNDLGYWVGTVDGKTGQVTQQALYAFQKIQGLPRSGTLDTATINALATATRPTPASSTGNHIEIDKMHQVIFFVQNGQTQWVFNTSTGIEKSYVTNGIKGFAHTPDGTFKVLRTVDAVDPGPLGALYRPRYFTTNGIAIHGAAAIPAQPASHGCARVSNAAMDFIWANNMMPLQSLVWVYDNPSAQPFTPPTTVAPSTTSTTATPTTTSTTVAATTSTSTSTSSTTTVPATTTTAAAAYITACVQFNAQAVRWYA